MWPGFLAVLGRAVESLTSTTGRVRTNSEPGNGAVAITPSDVTAGDIAAPIRALYVGGAGDVTLRTYDSAAAAVSILFSAVPAGTILPVKATRVQATGTTATLMTGIY